MTLSPLRASLVATALMAALAGCSTPGDEASVQPEAAPVAISRHSVGHVDAFYALGRYYQGQVRYDQAIKAYQDVLDAQPNHAEARNALGVIYAIQGHLNQAEMELRTALAAAPAAAHIHNNLGYALLLQGRVEEAIGTFEEALRLDPSCSRAADNLQAATEQLIGRPEEKIASPAPVSSGPVEKVAAVPVPSVETVPVSPLHRVAANVYELQLPVLPRPEPYKAAHAAPLRPADFRVEVSNGNGVEGLARRASVYLKGRGYGVNHLTNQKPYDQKLTEIQYRPGFEQQAKGLQALLAGKGVPAQTTRLRQDVELRLVLGHDLRQPAALAEIEARPVQVAAVGQ